MPRVVSRFGATPVTLSPRKWMSRGPPWRGRRRVTRRWPSGWYSCPRRWHQAKPPPRQPPPTARHRQPQGSRRHRSPRCSARRATGRNRDPRVARREGRSSCILQNKVAQAIAHATRLSVVACQDNGQALSLIKRNARPTPSAQSSVLSAGTARRDSVVLGVGGGLLLDERRQRVVVRLNPVRHEHPLLAVPLLDARGTATFVIGRTQLDTLQQAEEADLFQTSVIDRKVLERPVTFLAIERTVAELILAGSKRFDGQGGIDQSDIVVHRAEELQIPKVALAGLQDGFAQPTMNLEIGASRIGRESLVAFRGGPGRNHVGFRTSPDVAGDVVDRYAEARGGLDRDRRGNTPGAQEYPIWFRFAHLPPLRRLFASGIGDGNLNVLKAVFPRQNGDGGLRSPAIGGVMIDSDDLFPLQFVEPTFLLRDIIDAHRCLAVVVEQKREDIRKDQPVGRLGLSSGRINKRYLVLYRPLGQGISRRRAVGEEKGDRSTVLSILDAFVDLDGAIGTPLGLELLDLELHAVDATFDFVDVAEIIDLAGPPKRSGGRVGANPVRRQRHVLLVIAGISRR